MRGLHSLTRAWLGRIDVHEDWWHLYHIDTLIRDGHQGDEWLTGDCEFWLSSMRSIQAGLEGFKNFLHYDDCTTHRTVKIVGLKPGQTQDGPTGISAVQAGANIELGAHPSAWPGVSNTSCSIGVLITSNERGNFTELGGRGFDPVPSNTGHLAVRGSSGYRGYIWLSDPGQLAGGINAAGWHGGTRLDANNTRLVFSASTATVVSTKPNKALPDNNNVTLLALGPNNANPGINASPNSVAAGYIGEGLTQAALEKQRTDVVRYVGNVGLGPVLEIPAPILQPNMFGPDSIDQVIPSSHRILRSARPPANDGDPASAYKWYPMTDSVGRRTPPSTT
jgi:hypothetical protein